jgi:hypothetical protein
MFLLQNVIAALIVLGVGGSLLGKHLQMQRRTFTERYSDTSGDIDWFEGWREEKKVG